TRVEGYVWGRVVEVMGGSGDGGGVVRMGEKVLGSFYRPRKTLMGLQNAYKATSGGDGRRQQLRCDREMNRDLGEVRK
nr:hypothetical protein [Tanacetum cinerariifolium]